MDFIFYIQTGVMAFLFIWLIILTILFLRQTRHYTKLIKVTGKNNLAQILDQFLKMQKADHKQIETINKQLIKIDEDGQFYLQKIGFLRFNPFENTGGDQSFSLSLLDNHNNGMVFSFLHSRDTTRVYAKKVNLGKSEKFPLSKEEEKVIASARRFKS
jgi:uncharacterized protein DUF4446